VPRDGDGCVFHDRCAVDQPEIQIAVVLPSVALVQAADLMVQCTENDQRVQVAEPLAAQQLLGCHDMRPVPMRPIAERGQNWRQILDPNWSRQGLIVQEGGLIGQVEINRLTGLCDHGMGTVEMVRVGPGVIVVEEANIGSGCSRGARVASETTPMPPGTMDERHRPYPD
jgi:hypothetical protein